MNLVKKCSLFWQNFLAAAFAAGIPSAVKRLRLRMPVLNGFDFGIVREDAATDPILFAALRGGFFYAHTALGSAAFRVGGPEERRRGWQFFGELTDSPTAAFCTGEQLYRLLIFQEKVCILLRIAFAEILCYSIFMKIAVM